MAGFWVQLLTFKIMMGMLAEVMGLVAWDAWMMVVGNMEYLGSWLCGGWEGGERDEIAEMA